MKQEIKIAVLGGGGRTGKYLVTNLIDRGFSNQTASPET